MSARFQPYLVGLLLFGVTIGVDGRNLSNGFVSFDDTGYVTDNDAVKSGITASSLVYAWTTFHLGNWIPLTWMSFELDSALFGISANYFHLTNVLLHALNVILLFWVLTRMTQSQGCSAAVAILFAVHPLHVESVAWVSERKDVLSTAFLLLALLAYERYARRPSISRWSQVVIFMAVGLLAKSMLVTLPVLLFLVDWWPLNRIQEITRSNAETRYPPQKFAFLIYEKAPLFLLSMLDGIITVVAQRSSNALVSLEKFSAPVRVLNALQAYGWYVWKTALPFDLCVFYDLSFNKPDWRWIIASTVMLVTVTIVVLRSRQTHPHRLFGWGWFVISLLPVIGLIQVGGQSFADRYSYVPHIGLFAFVVYEVNAWKVQIRFGQKWCIAAIFVLAGWFSYLSIEQIGIWKGSFSLWSQVMRLYPHSGIANLMVGLALLEQGDLPEAERQMNKALDEKVDPRTIYSMGLVHEHRGEWNSAAECYKWALRVDPKYPSAIRRLADLEASHPGINSGSAVSQTTEQVRALIREGLTHAKRGDLPGALGHFQEAIEADPNSADAHNNAALALAQLNRLREAEVEQRKAVELAPDNPDFHVNLAVLLEKGQPNESAEHWRAALRLRPHDIEAKRRLQQIESRVSQP